MPDARISTVLILRKNSINFFRICPSSAVHSSCSPLRLASSLPTLCVSVPCAHLSQSFRCSAQSTALYVGAVSRSVRCLGFISAMAHGTKNNVFKTVVTVVGEMAGQCVTCYACQQCVSVFHSSCRRCCLHCCLRRVQLRYVTLQTVLPLYVYVLV